MVKDKAVITRVPTEVAQELAESALPALVALADWRNRSGSFPQQFIPYDVRKETENYQAS